MQAPCVRSHEWLAPKCKDQGGSLTRPLPHPPHVPSARGGWLPDQISLSTTGPHGPVHSNLYTTFPLDSDPKSVCFENQTRSRSACSWSSRRTAACVSCSARRRRGSAAPRRRSRSRTASRRAWPSCTHARPPAHPLRSHRQENPPEGPSLPILTRKPARSALLPKPSKVPAPESTKSC